jgi:hypothetical protein
MCQPCVAVLPPPHRARRQLDYRQWVVLVDEPAGVLVGSRPF